MATKKEITFSRSKGGSDREDACQEEFGELLLLWALARMKRRGSHTLDESDFDHAHRALLSEAMIDWPSQIIGYSLILAAGGLISWGVSYFPRNAGYPDILMGIALCAVGMGLGAVGVYTQLRRR